MKTLFLHSKFREDIKLQETAIDKLPKKIALATTIQYIDSIKNIKKELEESGRKVVLLQGKHSKYSGQILGCDIDEGMMLFHLKKAEFDAFLFIGDGLFHPKILLFMQKEKKKDVFVFNPLSKELRKTENSEINEIEKRLKGSLLKFHSAKNIGIIVSTKPGQQRLKLAIDMKKNLLQKEKNAYIFVCNTLDFSEIENFNFIDCFINTMCPRIGYDDAIRLEKPIINYDEIKNELK